MRVLVLGGTGAMGKALVNLLLQHGHQVTVTSRSPSNGKTRLGNKLVYLKGNAHNEVFFLNVLSTHWDVIVDFMVYSTGEFKNRVRTLLNATDQYFFLSSARVYADHPLNTETSARLLETIADEGYLKTDEYALAKARQENLLLESELKNWTVIRPYITFSEERLQLGVFEKEDWLYRTLKGRSIVFARDLANKCTTLTYGEDVAKGIVSLIGSGAATGQIYHIASETPICWEEVLDIYIKVLSDNGIHSNVFWIENMKVLSEIMGNRYQTMYDRLYNRKFASFKIKKYAGSDFQFSNTREKLSECLEDFLRNGRFKNINWTAQAYMDRVAGELTPFNEIKTYSDRAKYLLFRFCPIGTLFLLRSIRSMVKKVIR